MNHQFASLSPGEAVHLSPTAMSRMPHFHPRKAEAILAEKFGRLQLSPAEGERPVRQNWAAVQARLRKRFLLSPSQWCEARLAEFGGAQ